MLSLYLHIPFCRKKCHYCDFLSGPAEAEVQEAYVKGLCGEIAREANGYTDRFVDTVFLGGGTPSLLTPKQISELFEQLRRSFRILPTAEISMEANPGTLDREKLVACGRAGVNRLSIGLQSSHNEELKLLGRIHTWEDFLQSWELVRREGFENVNIDLMSALPGQTAESYGNTLKRVLELEPEHISAYSLIVEEGTLFHEWFGEEGCGSKVREPSVFRPKAELPDEETDRQMYELTRQMLGEAGYERYEISNYSRPGYECRHNVGYWTGKEYLGLGLGASSYIDHRRFEREGDLQTYLHKTKAGISTALSPQILSGQDEMEEFMFLGLRLMKGVSEDTFLKRFGISMRERYGKTIRELEAKGLLEWQSEGRLALTKFGIDVSNLVFGEFLS